MTKVLVTESYLQDIADSIRSKNGTQSTYKPSEMSTAIDSISGGGITPTGTKSISITQNGTTTEDVTNYASAEITVNVSGGSTPTLQSKSVSYTPTTSSQSETVTADSGYDGLSSVAVTVDAVATGTEGTPTATKGSVSNNAVTVTPSVTNTQGYIQGSTKTGTAVTVQASELVSGTLNITENGTHDVTNYANAVVNVASGLSFADFVNGVVNNTLTSITDSSITTFPSNSMRFFYGCTSLESVTFNAMTQLRGSNHFRGCTNLTSISFPALTDAGSGGSNFMGCTSLVSVDWHNITTGQISGSEFSGCTNLTFIDLGAPITRLMGNAFENCPSLTTVVIRSTSVLPLLNINAFTGTPFANGGTGGTIYVPSALISSYQTATNWSTLYGYGTVTFEAIEGSEYEIYYADGTVISS